MPEPEVIETEQIEETVEEETPSPSESAEPAPEEPQAPGSGEEIPTEEQPAEEPKPAGEKTPEEKAKAREEFLKRQIEKKDKELAEARTAAETSPTRQQELARQAQDARQAEIQEYVDNLGISPEQAEFMLNKQEAKARQIAASQVQPLTGTYFRSQYESIKKDLAADPEIVDFKAIEAEVDKLARGYEVGNQSFYLGNKTVVKSWALYVQGQKSKDMIKAAEERGRVAALKDKRIEGEARMPKTTVTGVNTGGITQADIELADKRGNTPEFERDLRIAREKQNKEREKSKK